MTVTIHQQIILLVSDASYIDIINEIHTRIYQSKGIASMLCNVDLSNQGNMVDDAVSNSAWKLNDELDIILALANALYEHTKLKAKATPGGEA